MTHQTVKNSFVLVRISRLRESWARTDHESNVFALKTLNQNQLQKTWVAARTKCGLWHEQANPERGRLHEQRVGGCMNKRRDVRGGMNKWNGRRGLPTRVFRLSPWIRPDATLGPSRSACSELCRRLFPA